MIKSHKIRLNPTVEQAEYFMKAAGTARYTYNWAVEQWRKASLKPSAMRLKKEFNKIKPAWCYEVTKCAVEGAFFDFATALKNYYEGRAAEPQFKKRAKGDFAFYIANDKFNIIGYYIKIPKLGLVNLAEKLRFKGKILSATLTKEADFWYVSVSVEMKEQVKEAKEKECGVDVGLLRLITLSDGTMIDNPRPLRKVLSRLARLQQLLEKKVKGSKNREKLKRKIARLHKKVKDIRDDILHKISRYIANNYGFVAVENLNLKGMVKNHKLALSLQDAALGKLLKLIENKVISESGQFVKVDRFFPSSKLCSNCSTKVEDLSLDTRTYKCGNCLIEIDRDLNASINILREGLRLCSKLSPSGSGYDRR